MTTTTDTAQAPTTSAGLSGAADSSGGRVFAVQAIAPEVLAQLRISDDAGRPPRLLVDEEGGAPLRCCLRRIEPGERVALVSYAPLHRWARATGADPGAYDETGPVFIHPEPCPAVASCGYPVALAGRPQVFRSYSAAGQILDGRLFGVGGPADVASAEQLLTEIFADPQVSFVHARAVAFGCFTFEVRRAAA